VRPFQPHWEILPPEQKNFLPELQAVPKHFVLYGGTALALRLRHRQSLDFDFFSAESFHPEVLQRALPFAAHADVIQQSENTLTIRTPPPRPIRLSFFGGLTFGQMEPPDACPETGFGIAGLKDLFATKLNTIYQRAEAKDYLDIEAILSSGETLANGLGYAQAIYSQRFNSLLPLKALSFFGDGDLPSLPQVVKLRLTQAVQGVTSIPAFVPSSSRIQARRPD
jgi:hypothetical protein